MRCRQSARSHRMRGSSFSAATPTAPCSARRLPSACRVSSTRLARPRRAARRAPAAAERRDRHRGIARADLAEAHGRGDIGCANSPAYLTPREYECLALVVSGMDTAAMSRQLGVSRTTIRSHVQSMLMKLSVHSRLEAAALAVQHHLLAEAATPVGSPRVPDHGASSSRALAGDTLVRMGVGAAAARDATVCAMGDVRQPDVRVTMIDNDRVFVDAVLRYCAQLVPPMIVTRLDVGQRVLDQSEPGVCRCRDARSRPAR